MKRLEEHLFSAETKLQPSLKHRKQKQHFQINKVEAHCSNLLNMHVIYDLCISIQTSLTGLPSQPWTGQCQYGDRVWDHTSDHCPQRLLAIVAYLLNFLSSFSESASLGWAQRSVCSRLRRKPTQNNGSAQLCGCVGVGSRCGQVWVHVRGHNCNTRLQPLVTASYVIQHAQQPLDSLQRFESLLSFPPKETCQVNCSTHDFPALVATPIVLQSQVMHYGTQPHSMRLGMRLYSTIPIHHVSNLQL